MSFKKIDNQVNLQSQGGEDQQIREIVRTFIDEWKDCSNEHFKIEKLTGGVTNHLYKCSCQSEPSLQVLVRIYGNDTSLFIDRESELKILADLHQGNVGPKVYGAFANGFVYEYLEGRTLAPEDVTDGTWYEEIGREIAKWHTMNHMTGDQEAATVSQNIQKWLKLIPESYGDKKKDELLKELSVARLRDEAVAMQQEIDKLNSPIVFCHNDLFHGNMIVDDNARQLKFIDYEYSGYNYRGFDLGAFLAEWSGLDYKNYPSKEKQLKFFQSYLKAVNKREPTEKELQELYVEAYKFSLVAHFSWGLWSLVQSAISDIDYDYLEYGKNRLDQYFANKDKLVQ